MRRVPSISGSSAASVASRLRTLGAIAHFDPSWGATDDATTSTWTDRIGGTVCQSTSTATRLVYSASQAGLNGRPGWTCDDGAVTRLLSTTATLAQAIDGAQAITVYTVKKATAPGATAVWLCAGSTTLGDHVYFGVTVASSANKFIFSRSSGGVQTTNTLSVIRPLTAATVTSVVYSGSAMSAWENGGPTELAGANVRTPVCDRICIGAILNAGAYSNAFDGILGDIVIFASAHDATTRRSIEQLLAIKYGWPVLQGVSGFAAPNYLRTAVGEGPRGATGVGAWNDYLMRWDATPGTEYVGVAAAGNTGHLTYTSAANQYYRAGNGAANVLSPAVAVGANDIGKLLLFGGTADLLLSRAFKNGAEVGAGTALVGYTADATTRFEISDAVPGVSLTMFGCAGGNVPQTAANQAGRAAAIKAANAFVATGGATPTHAWAINGTDASFSDLVGTDVLTRVGTLTAAQIIMTAWPW